MTKPNYEALAAESQTALKKIVAILDAAPSATSKPMEVSLEIGRALMTARMAIISGDIDTAKRQDATVSR